MQRCVGKDQAMLSIPTMDSENGCRKQTHACDINGHVVNKLTNDHSSDNSVVHKRENVDIAH